MNEQMLGQLLGELIDAQEQALAIIAGACSDACGPQFAEALKARLETAKAANDHPMRDKLLTTAVRAASVKR
jgi:hypothetical protein